MCTLTVDDDLLILYVRQKESFSFSIAILLHYLRISYSLSFHRMAEKIFEKAPSPKVQEVEDGILHIPPQMKYVEVIQYLKTYKHDIKQLHIRDRTEGMKKIMKEIEHLPNLEFIEIKRCNIGVDSSKRNLKDVFKGIFDRCTKLKQIVYEHTDRRPSGHADIKTMIKKKGSTIVEIGVQSEATSVEPEKKT